MRYAFGMVQKVCGGRGWDEEAIEWGRQEIWGVAVMKGGEDE